MQIPRPNLRLMLHFYTSPEHLFQTVTMYPSGQREAVLDRIVETEGWYGGRFAVGHREAYMRKRLFVEQVMYDEFATKYGKPPSKHPVFFYLRPDLDLDVVDRELEQRRAHGETRTRYLVIDLGEIVDTAHISFTLFDSHRSYVLRSPREAADPDPVPVTSPLPDQGTLFHIFEIKAVFARNRDVRDLSFEVQVWDPGVLTSAPCLPLWNHRSIR